MTTPHPTPEERYEAAVKDLKQVIEDEYGTEIDFGVMIEGQDLFKIAMTIALREAEAAGEARGRAMEREQMRTEALKVLSHVSDDDVENGRVFDRVDAALRAHTDKENSGG